MRSLFYALDNKKVVHPVDNLTEWGTKWRKNRRVALTNVLGTTVSTVFLGIDHSFGHGAAPMLFETMVFPTSELIGRCSTWQEAKELHERAVQRIKSS